MQTASEKKVDLKQSSEKITQPKIPPKIQSKIQVKNQPIIQPKTKNSAPKVDNGAKIVIDQIPVFEPEENTELEKEDALINQ